MFNIGNLTVILFSAVASLIALTVHEYCHGYAAYKLGDNTARNLGRLTLNPLRHIDIVGVITMIFFHFGWAKPVPINARNFKRPKRDFAITALAGPLSNILLAFLSTPLFLLITTVAIRNSDSISSEFLIKLIYNAILFLQYFVIINLGLGVFNLIPLPPFDGSRIINVILPEKWYFKIMRYERYIYFGVIGWLFLGNYVYRGLISIQFIASSPVLSTIARVFSLSGLISDGISFFTEAFISFWSLFIH